MRTMKKSGVFAALTVALLVMVVLVTQGCFAPDTEPVDISTITGLERTGTVRIIFGDKADARTILPEEPEFTRYDLAFEHASNNTLDRDDSITAPATAITTALTPGNYTLTVIGYADSPASPGTDVAVAEASTDVGGGITTNKDVTPPGNGFTIEANTVTIVTVVLKPYALGTGTGTLSWDIDFTGIPTANTAVLTIHNYAGTQLGNSEDLTDEKEGRRNLTSGYYWVNIKIGAPNLGSVSFRDLVHIYQNMESLVEPTFANKHLYLPPASGAGSDITYIHPEDTPFVLTVVSTPDQPDGTDGTEAHPIVVARTGTTTLPTSATVTLTNASIFPGGYTWTYDEAPVGTASTLLTVNTTNPPFNAPGTRRITLTGVVNAGVTPPETYTAIIEIEVR